MNCDCSLFSRALLLPRWICTKHTLDPLVKRPRWWKTHTNTPKHNRRHLTITECLRKCNIGCKTILSSLNGIIPCNYLKANLMVVKLGGFWFFSTYMNFGERWIASAMLVEVMSLILPKPIYTNRPIFAPFHLWVIVYAHFLAKYSLILWALIHMIMALSISIKPS